MITPDNPNHPCLPHYRPPPQVGSFPYPLKTKVARDFGEHGIFWGVIEKHYPDDPNVCLVRFTDGDSEDLDREEIQYAIELYEKEFGVETSD